MDQFKRIGLILVPLAALTLFAGCQGETSSDSESNSSSDFSGLKVVPVFGPDKNDVSKDVDWFGSDIGRIGGEKKTESGVLWGYDFETEFRSTGQDGVYPIAEGEIGVILNFDGHSHVGRYQLPAPDGDKQVLEVPLTGVGQIVLDAEGLADTALVDLGFDGPRGGSVSTTGWRNHKGAYYRIPGQYTITLTNKDTSESHNKSLTVIEGESQNVTFTFTQ